MLCRRRRQQAKDLLVDTRYKAISTNKHRKNTPSSNVSLAPAILLVDWSISPSHSRVFLRNNPETADTHGTLSSRPQAALIPAYDCGRPSMGGRGFRTIP
jgi:hypothetical protein